MATITLSKYDTLRPVIGIKMSTIVRKIGYAITLCLMGALSSGHAQDAPNLQIKEPALRRELLKRVEQDQAIRNELISAGVKNPDKAILARMESIDAANTERMTAIVNQYGWPGPELVGRDGSEAAFLLVQHADLGLQQKVLPLVEKAYRSGGLSGQDYALLLDRVRVAEGKPQVYGTQAKRFEEWNGSEPTLQPIEDEANVDKRRAEVGLPPLAEYREILKRMYFPKGQRKP
jgi:uncharacterized protein DUF6624